MPDPYDNRGLHVHRRAFDVPWQRPVVERVWCRGEALSRTILFGSELQELLGVPQGLGRNTLAGKHSADFAGSGRAVEFLYRGQRPSLGRVLFHIVMMVGK